MLESKREAVERGKKFFQVFPLIGMIDGCMDAWVGCLESLTEKNKVSEKVKVQIYLMFCVTSDCT